MEACSNRHKWYFPWGNHAPTGRKWNLSSWDCKVSMNFLLVTTLAVDMHSFSCRETESVSPPTTPGQVCDSLYSTEFSGRDTTPVPNLCLKGLWTLWLSQEPFSMGRLKKNALTCWKIGDFLDQSLVSLLPEPIPRHLGTELTIDKWQSPERAAAAPEPVKLRQNCWSGEL